MAAKDPRFIITYKYANPDGKIRNATGLWSGTDAAGAKKKASETLALEHDWHRIGTVTPAD